MTNFNSTKDTVPALVASNILPRKDDYIMMTKKELHMTENFSTTMDIIYDITSFFGSGMLGFMLGTIPSFSKLYICGWFITCILLALSLFARTKKTSTIMEILKMYQD